MRGNRSHRIGGSAASSARPGRSVPLEVDVNEVVLDKQEAAKLIQVSTRTLERFGTTAYGTAAPVSWFECPISEDRGAAVDDGGAMMEVMTKGERRELQSLARQRGRVAKNEVRAYGEKQMARLEAELASRNSQHREVWARIEEQAREIANQSDEKLRALCRKLGVRESFCPRLHVQDYRCGQDSEVRHGNRLLEVAQSQIEAISRMRW